MDNYQEARLDSYKLIVTESKSKAESLAKVPKFARLIDRLMAINAEIDRLHLEQGKDLTGITVDKDDALEKLVDMTIEVSGAVYSFALDNKNNALMAKVNQKPYSIERMAQNEVVNYAGIVCEEAKGVPAEDLADEGITADELTNFEALIAHFKAIKTSNREAVIDRSGVTEQMRTLFDEANKIVKDQLDRLSVQYKRKDPDFYLRYKTARQVHTRKATKKGSETDIESSEVAV